VRIKHVRDRHADESSNQPAELESHEKTVSGKAYLYLCDSLIIAVADDRDVSGPISLKVTAGK